MIYLLLVYILIVIILYTYSQIYLNKKHSWWLNLIHSITLWFTYLLEKLWILNIRNKYKKQTPKVIELLKELDIKFHIVYGTFLFAYRNNNFADEDIDIGIFEEDFSLNINEKLSKNKFLLQEEWYLDGYLKEQTYVNKTLRISMDIFIISKNKIFAIGFDEKNNRYSKKEDLLLYSLKEINVNGTKVMAPAESKKYLEWIYFEWEKKDPNYHWLYGPSKRPNIIVENATNIKYIKYDNKKERNDFK